MGVFDSIHDSPLGLRTEGQQIEIVFQRTGPTTARVSWTIPSPAAGCSADNRHYDGIVITLDTQPVSAASSPVDNTYYAADATANTDLHAGDVIGTALVVGAFYSDTETTYLDITDLVPNTAYYASGFALDAQARFHTEGVHTYSLPNKGDDIQPFDLYGYQIFETDVTGTDATGLSAGQFYELIITLNRDGNEHTISIDGNNSVSYNDLIAELNNKFALIDNPFQGASPANTNGYYVSNSQVSQWDGQQHNPIDVIFEAQAPNSQIVDDRWYDEVNQTMYKWNGVGWVAQVLISYYKDPKDVECGEYWFNGVNAYKWTGTVWDRQTLYNQLDDPSAPPTIECSTYWYDMNSEVLYKWNSEACTGSLGPDWKSTLAILWDTAPNNAIDGVLWYNDTTNVLYESSAGSWVELNVINATTTPTTLVDQIYWYNSDTQVLQQYDFNNAQWNLVDFILWDNNPLTPSSGDVWWNTISDEISEWDELTNSWQVVTSFYINDIDPSLAEVVPMQALWYNSTNMYIWDGSGWLDCVCIEYNTDPTSITAGINWYDTTNALWYEYNGTTWDNVIPTEHPSDPYLPTTGDYWFDTTNNTLFQWNGANWVPILFSTIPLTPTKGELWFNTTNSTLYKWNGVAYVEEPLKVDAVLTLGVDHDVGIKFTDKSAEGSLSLVFIDSTSSLLQALQPAGKLGVAYYGSDTISGQSMYEQVGVGTDGSEDERREMMDSLRRQFGWPTVKVELDNYQMDLAITAGLEELRRRSSAAYKRGFFFLSIPPGKQSFILNNKHTGMNTIVSVLAIWRARYTLFGHGGNSSADTTGNQGQAATSAGYDVWTQLFYQQLQSGGQFDLITYHALGDYLETINQLFANDITYNFNEHTRRLNLYTRLRTNETVLMETAVERTENELLRDRYTKGFIETWAYSEVCHMLSEVRGKFASLPGAGGGVSLNAGELAAKGNEVREQALSMLDDYVIEQPEEFGGGVSFIIG